MHQTTGYIFLIFKITVRPQLESSERVKSLRRRWKIFENSLHEIPSALQSEDYETAKFIFLNGEREKIKVYVKLERKAKSMDFALKSTKIGIETIPVANGRQMMDKDYNKLTDAERDEVEAKRMDFEPLF